MRHHSPQAAPLPELCSDMGPAPAQEELPSIRQHSMKKHLAVMALKVKHLTRAELIGRDDDIFNSRG